MKTIKNIFFAMVFAIVVVTATKIQSSEQTALKIAQEEACKIIDRLLMGKKAIEQGLIKISEENHESDPILLQRYNDIQELTKLIEGGIDIKICGLNSLSEVLTEADKKFEESIQPQFIPGQFVPAEFV